MIKYIIFSFDDGREDQFKVAFEVLSKYGFPATINVVSEFVNNEKKFNCFNTISDKSLTWNNLFEMEKKGKWEIACHGANHQNSVEDIKKWLNDRTVLEHGWDKNVGFASPESMITPSSHEEIQHLVESKDLLYIRSGKQIRRENYWIIFLEILNRIIKCPKLFVFLNKDCIYKETLIHSRRVLLSVGITSYNTENEVFALLERMRDHEVIILMFHSIIDDSFVKKANDRWYWEKSKLISLCEYIKHHAEYRVVTTRDCIMNGK